MIVSDLILKLQDCLPDAEVVVLNDFDVRKLRSVEQMRNVARHGVGIKLLEIEQDKNIVLLS